MTSKPIAHIVITQNRDSITERQQFLLGSEQNNNSEFSEQIYRKQPETDLKIRTNGKKSNRKNETQSNPDEKHQLKKLSKVLESTRSKKKIPDAHFIG